MHNWLSIVFYDIFVQKYTIATRTFWSKYNYNIRMYNIHDEEISGRGYSFRANVIYNKWLSVIKGFKRFMFLEITAKHYLKSEIK